MYSRNWSLKEPSAKQAKLATKSPLSRSNSSSFNPQMEGKDYSFSTAVFHPWVAWMVPPRGSAASPPLQSCSSLTFSFSGACPLLPFHLQPWIAQYFCWNECSWNASPGAGWQTKNEQGSLGAADSFSQSTRRPGLPGCPGTTSVVLSYTWHLFAAGWFSGWAVRHWYPFWCSRSSGTGSIPVSASPSHCYHMHLLSQCYYCG